MYALTKLLLLTLATAVFCYDGLTFKDLKPELAKQLRSVLKDWSPSLNPKCEGTPNPKVEYWLYSRDNPDKPIAVNPSDPTQVDPRRKVVFLVHGWLSNYTTSHFQKLKDAYIGYYNVHLIAVDWSESAWKLYDEAYCDLDAVGKKIGDLLCILKDRRVRLNTVHVLGHGLGGHILGFMGQHVLAKCGQKVGRLSGMDPASHLFKYRPEEERLDPSDGDLVDVIHTDGMRMGYSAICGTVDFHPNCGYPQPGCPSLGGLEDDMLISDAMCSTIRSIEYYTESVESKDFIGVSCGRCPTYCSPDIINEVYAIMGNHYIPVQPPAHKYLNFYLPTNKSPPYAQGDIYSLRINSTVLCKNAEESDSVLLRKMCDVRL